jgi:hypothetical protein
VEYGKTVGIGRRFAGGSLGDQCIDIDAHGDIVPLDGPAELEALIEGGADRPWSQQADAQPLAGRLATGTGMALLGAGDRAFRRSMAMSPRSVAMTGHHVGVGGR